MDFVVSDAHGGLIKAVAKHCQGTLWQRCQVPLLRNVLGYVAHKDQAELASAAANVLRGGTAAEARTRLAALAQQFPKATKAIECLEAGLDDALAVLALPEKYRLRLRTTNIAGAVKRRSAPARTGDSHLSERSFGIAFNRRSLGRTP